MGRFRIERLAMVLEVMRMMRESVGRSDLAIHLKRPAFSECT